MQEDNTSPEAKTRLRELFEQFKERKRKRAIGVQEARPTRHPGSKKRSSKKHRRAVAKRAKASRKLNRK